MADKYYITTAIDYVNSAPHIGTAYIALFNYAFAKRHGGRFVLRRDGVFQIKNQRIGADTQTLLELALAVARDK